MNTKSVFFLGAFILATPLVRMADSDFMNTASRANLSEIAAAQLAASKATSPAIRAFADSMIADHSAAEQELIGLATKEGVSLAQAMDADHARVNQQLAQVSGKQFDSAYVHLQVLDHQVVVQLFQQEYSLGRDSLARMYATKYLPRLQHHLEMAKQLWTEHR